MTNNQNDAERHYRDGVAAHNAARYPAALIEHMKCISLVPSHCDAWAGAGAALMMLLRWRDAVSCFEFIIAAKPDHADALTGLAASLVQLGETEGARAYAERAVEANPRAAVNWANRACIHAMTGAPPEQVRALFEAWGKRFADPLTRGARRVDDAPRDPGRRLRVGYVSGDLRNHAVAFFMEPILRHHDPDAFEIHVFSTLNEDDVSRQLMPLVSEWHGVTALDDDALAARIRSSRIDILVDLSGHSVGQRLLVFARRPAPVQVTWLGFLYTLGMRAIDYRLTDWGMDPPGAEARYTETLFRLNCMATYQPPPETPFDPSPPALRNGYVSMISLNNTRKLSDDMLRVWGEILAARPACGLILVAFEVDEWEARKNVVPRLARLGLPLDRVSVVPRQPLDAFMRMGTVADFSLDTAPVSGGTTTLHALWMGLPVLTMNGEDAAAASSARTLQGVGLHEMVVDSPAAYLQKALSWIDDLDALRDLRAKTRPALQASVLMDYKARTRELETAYRIMWRNHLRGDKRILDLREENPTEAT